MRHEKEKQVIVHDIRGQICPSSLLFTLKEINDQQPALKEDSVKIIIKTDNRNAVSTIPHAVSTMGYRSTVAKKENYYQIEITAK
jgi:TusA-related sulfurtransferase